MSSGQVLTNNGRKIALNRLFKSSPDYTAPSVFKVGTGTNTPAVTDSDLQTSVIISGGNYTKIFISGYPLLDETNMQSTIRCLLLTTEANGNSLTEFGIFNTDGTAKMLSRTVHTAITKTTSVQVIYIEKDKITTV
jgi:hypothetical protein